MDGISENNLLDAGCNRALIAEFCALMQNKQGAEALKLLKRQREKLLKTYHEQQKKIDVIDFLIFQLKQDLLKETSDD